MTRRGVLASLLGLFQIGWNRSLGDKKVEKCPVCFGRRTVYDADIAVSNRADMYNRNVGWLEGIRLARCENCGTLAGVLVAGEGK